MSIDKSIIKESLTLNPDLPIWDGLVGAWLFDDGSGTTVTDYGPKGHNITLVQDNILDTYTWNADGVRFDSGNSQGAGGYVQGVTFRNGVRVSTIIELVIPYEDDAQTYLRVGYWDGSSWTVDLNNESDLTEPEFHYTADNSSLRCPNPIVSNSFKYDDIIVMVTTRNAYVNSMNLKLSSPQSNESYEETYAIPSTALEQTDRTITVSNMFIDGVPAGYYTQKATNVILLIWDRALDEDEITEIIDAINGKNPWQTQAPVNLQATDGAFTDKVVVTWDEVEGASYILYRNETDDSGTADAIANLSINTYEDTNVVSETIYYYWVKAVDGTTSDFSEGDSGYASAVAQAEETPGVNDNDEQYMNLHKNAKILSLQSLFVPNLARPAYIRNQLRKERSLI